MKNDRRYIEWISSDGNIACPGGESRNEFSKRCVEAYKEIKENFRYENVAVIAHGGTIMSIMNHIFKGNFYDYYVDNLSGYIITDDGKYSKL